MEPRQRCDLILRLIDETLGEPPTGGPAGTAQGFLAVEVRRWVEDVAPGDTPLADAAVAAAMAAYAEGASVDAACAGARRLVQSWQRHPSQPRPARRMPVAS